MRGTKINAVLNVMTSQQMQERGIEWSTVSNDLRSQGISHVVHCPVDMNSPMNHEHVFEAVQRLHELVINKKSVVYVMSQSGRTTAPTVVLAYVCLFKRVTNWESHHQAYTDHVKRNDFHINETLVEKIIDDNLEFQAR